MVLVLSPLLQRSTSLGYSSILINVQMLFPLNIDCSHLSASCLLISRMFLQFLYADAIVQVALHMNSVARTS